MTDFEAMRRLALTLGVSAPESNEDIFNASFINTLTRAVKRNRAGVDNLHRELEEKTKVFDSATRLSDTYI
jgi:hypothetical protein